MYKILIKYTSKLNKTFWYSHEITNENGETVEFATDNVEALETELCILDKKYGHENLRVIIDVTYDVKVDIFDSGAIQLATSEDVEDLYATAFNNVFGEGDGV